MADLVVDLSMLQETAGSLGMLIEEFNRASQIVDDNRGAIGENALLHALDDFVDNWKVHRDELLESMKAVYDMATQSHDGYIQVDNELAQAIAQDVQQGDTVRIGHPQ
jgi:nucleoid-associated protein YejK